MRKVFVTFVSVTIVVTTTAFLIGLRLEAKWAGGQGPTPLCQATPISSPETLVSRGQVMESTAETFASYELCDGTRLYLDVNTQIRLSKYRHPDKQTETELELIQGRVIVDGLADVRTRNVIVSTRGSGCELVHYSWRNEVDVTSLAEAGCFIQTSPISFERLETLRLNTFDTSVIDSSIFNAETSAANKFYLWTGFQFETLP